MASENFEGFGKAGEPTRTGEKMEEIEISKKDLINDKDIVIIQKGNYLKSSKVMGDRPQKFGKPGRDQLTINLSGAIGHFFGSSFKMVKTNSKVYNLEPTDEQLIDLMDIDTESGYDNRDLYDDGQNQSLSKEDIKQLVDSGKSGDEVIQSLVQNNKTFASKTKYSQEKYVSKKQKKYAEVIVLHRPSISLLNHMYYMHDPLRISNLRIDTLSQILTYSNVQPGGNFAVYEAGIQGLVTASMLQRIGLNGSLIHIYTGACPHKDSVELMEFSEEELKTLSFIAADNLPDISVPSAISERFLPKTSEKLVDISDIGGDLSQSEIEDLKDSARSNKTSKARKFVRTRSEDVRRSVEVLSEGLHGLVVACRQHPLTITLALLPYLMPGHSFVIYSPYKEPLMDLFMALKNENCVNIRLTENWLRNYQVLLQRTHPEINMSGGGGYLLTGWKISS